MAMDKIKKAPFIGAKVVIINGANSALVYMAILRLNRDERGTQEHSTCH
jgi:hypothetical protein